MKVTSDGKRLGWSAELDSGLTPEMVLAESEDAETITVLGSRGPCVFIAVPLDGEPFVALSSDMTEAEMQAFGAYREAELLHPASLLLVDALSDARDAHGLKIFESTNPLGGFFR